MGNNSTVRYSSPGLDGICRIIPVQLSYDVCEKYSMCAGFGCFGEGSVSRDIYLFTRLPEQVVSI